MAKFRYMLVNIDDDEKLNEDFDLEHFLNEYSKKDWQFVSLIDNDGCAIFKKEIIEKQNEEIFVIEKIKYYEFTDRYLRDMQKSGLTYVSHSYQGNPNFEFVIVFKKMN